MIKSGVKKFHLAKNPPQMKDFIELVRMLLLILLLMISFPQLSISNHISGVSKQCSQKTRIEKVVSLPLIQNIRLDLMHFISNRNCLLSFIRPFKTLRDRVKMKYILRTLYSLSPCPLTVRVSVKDTHAAKIHFFIPSDSVPHIIMYFFCSFSFLISRARSVQDTFGIYEENAWRKKTSWKWETKKSSWERREKCEMWVNKLFLFSRIHSVSMGWARTSKRDTYSNV